MAEFYITTKELTDLLMMNIGNHGFSRQRSICLANNLVEVIPDIARNDKQVLAGELGDLGRALIEASQQILKT